MDDITICRRIAEIEDIPNLYFQFGKVRVCVHDGDDYYYNPLKDDALCFQLMVKYQVQIGHENPDYMFAQCEYNAIEYSNTNKPNKAICLAIIEAHKDL